MSFFSVYNVRNNLAFKKPSFGCRAVGISFRKTAKTCLIPLNGRLALKFNPGQPHKIDSFVAVAFSACAVPLYKDKGAFNKHRRICVAAFLKEIPTALLRLFSKR